MSAQIVCKFSKIRFEAATKRTQVHPKIAAWKQEANKRGWYRRFFEAIEYGLANKFETIEQFEEILGKAQKDELFEPVKSQTEVVEEEAEHQLKSEATITFVTGKHLGSIGTVIEHKGQQLFVLHCEGKDRYEDDDGVTHEGYGGSNAMYDWIDYTYYCRPATKAEIAALVEKKRGVARRKEARARLIEISKSISVKNGAVAPTSVEYPEGRKLPIRQGLTHANKLLVMTETQLWSLNYNGADGDDWSHNNVSGAWIGCYVPLSSELKTEIEGIVETLKGELKS